MKTEKTFKIVDEEWRLSFQSFTHSPDMNLRCRFYMTRSYNFKSLELKVTKTKGFTLQLYFFTQEHYLTCHYPDSIKEAKVQILKFLTEC